MSKKYSAKALILACVAGILIAGIGGGIYFVAVFGGTESISAASKFAAIYNVLDSKFVGDADMDAVTDAAYRAMVEAVEDRWSYYMTPEEYKAYKEYQNNSYTGIGVTIEEAEESGYLIVKGVTEDSPASRAGINPGELMIALDGQSLEGMSATDVRTLISEKGGEEFELSLRDISGGDDGAERTVRISTEVVFSNPVAYDMLSDGIGYIRIKNFESESGRRAIDAVDELMAQGARGIVFDVRNNPGGLLSELTKLLDYLLPEGEMFVSVDENGRESVKVSDAQSVDLPMTVLVNSDSYSAAEFFAAALAEYEMAELVGIATTGKSRSQVNIQLADGSVVHLSTNGYLTPNRVDLAVQGGLTPDYVLKLPEKADIAFRAGNLEFEEDVQLQKAFSVIKEKLAA